MRALKISTVYGEIVLDDGHLTELDGRLSNEDADTMVSDNVILSCMSLIHATNDKWLYVDSIMFHSNKTRQDCRGLNLLDYFSKEVCERAEGVFFPVFDQDRSHWILIMCTIGPDLVQTYCYDPLNPEGLTAPGFDRDARDVYAQTLVRTKILDDRRKLDSGCLSIPNSPKQCSLSCGIHCILMAFYVASGRRFDAPDKFDPTTCDSTSRRAILRSLESFGTR